MIQEPGKRVGGFTAENIMDQLTTSYPRAEFLSVDTVMRYLADSKYPQEDVYTYSPTTTYIFFFILTHTHYTGTRFMEVTSGHYLLTRMAYDAAKDRVSDYIYMPSHRCNPSNI